MTSARPCQDPLDDTIASAGRGCDQRRIRLRRDDAEKTWVNRQGADLRFFADDAFLRLRRAAS
jgi:hypothetical protein